MALLIYIYILIIIYFISSWLPQADNPVSGWLPQADNPVTFLSYSIRKQTVLPPDRNTEQIEEYSKKAPWVILLLIALVLSIYSKYIGYTGNLIDRVSYTYSFLYRYPNYYDSLEAIIHSGIEPGIILLSKAIYTFTRDVNWLFFCTTLLSSFINSYVLYKMTRNFKLSVAFTMLSLFFFQSTYLIKQTLAVAFANLALLAFLKKKFFSYFICSILACSFHITAIILFPLYFIFRMRKTKVFYSFLLMLFLISFFGFSPIMRYLASHITFFSSYLSLKDLSYSFGTGSTTAILKGFPYYLLSGLALINRDRLKKELEYADFYITATMIYSFGWLFTFHMYWSFRIGWYVMLPILAMLPSLFRCMKGNKAYLFLGGIAVVSMIFFTFRQIVITLY